MIEVKNISNNIFLNILVEKRPYEYISFRKLLCGSIILAYAELCFTGVMCATRWNCIKTNGSWYDKKNET